MRIRALTLSFLSAGLIAAFPALAQNQPGDQQADQQAQQNQQQTQQNQQQAQQNQQPDQQLVREEAPGIGTMFYVGPSGIERVQQALRDQGHDPGVVDGQWGESTANALREYQRTTGIEATGNLNLRTLASLNLGNILTDSPQDMAARNQDQVGDQAQAQDQAAADRDTGVAIGGQDQAQAQANRQVQFGAQSDAPLYASPATVHQIQMALNREGFNAGNPDGIWGEQTAEALRSFQSARGLDPTGNLNFRTMESLGMGDFLNQVMAGNAMAGIDGNLTLSQEAVDAGGAAIYVGPESVREVQQYLAQQGHNITVDGMWGDNTSNALREFQQANNLPATGNLNHQTLASLNVDAGFGGVRGGGDVQQQARTLDQDDQAIDQDRQQQAAQQDDQAIDQDRRQQAAQQDDADQQQ